MTLEMRNLDNDPFEVIHVVKKNDILESARTGDEKCAAERSVLLRGGVDVDDLVKIRI